MMKRSEAMLARDRRHETRASSRSRPPWRALRDELAGIEAPRPADA